MIRVSLKSRTIRTFCTHVSCEEEGTNYRNLVLQCLLSRVSSGSLWIIDIELCARLIPKSPGAYDQLEYRDTSLSTDQSLTPRSIRDYNLP
jgi:hypothetical protein